MATTYSFVAGSTIKGVKVPIIPTPQEDRLFILRNIIDFSKQTIDVSESDVAQVLNIPAGTTVMTVFVRVITAETAAADFELGYGGSASLWGTGLGADGTAGTILGAIQDWVPLYFASADTIDIVGSGAVDLDAFKFEVTAICLKSMDTY